MIILCILFIIFYCLFLICTHIYHIYTFALVDSAGSSSLLTGVRYWIFV